MAPGDRGRLAHSGGGVVRCSPPLARAARADGAPADGHESRAVGTPVCAAARAAAAETAREALHTVWARAHSSMCACACVCSVALAAVEHERNRAQSTGASVLCGSVLSCSDGLEKRPQLRAQRPRLQRLESDADEGDGSGKPETMEQAYQGFDVKTFGGEATGAPSPFWLSPPGAASASPWASALPRLRRLSAMPECWGATK